MKKETSAWVEEINKKLDECWWDRNLGLSPDRLEDDDPRTGPLMYLGWLLSDLPDLGWDGWGAGEMAKLLRKIADCLDGNTK